MPRGIEMKAPPHLSDGVSRELRLAEWIPVIDGQIICHTHLPHGTPAAGVVICSPLYLELSQSYRAEVLLADVLASAGIGTQRFEYRGFGNSVGRPEDLTLESAVRDCLAAAERLCHHTKTDSVGIVGIRWGAFVAASAAKPTRASALALWEAKPSGRDYFADLLRTRRFYDLRSARRHPGGYYEQRLEAGEPVDMSGWRIHPGVYATTVSESLAQRMRANPVPTLLVHTTEGVSDGERLISALEPRAGTVDLVRLGSPALWWSARNPLLEPAAAPPALQSAVDPTAAWLVERLRG